MRLLVLRPDEGAAATAARVRALGHEAATAPLFRYRPLGWEPPAPDAQDAVMLTSAAAARLGGAGLERLLGLPAFAVGEATAAAARAAGFRDVRAGSGDARAVLDAVAAAGIGRVLHLTGREHRAVSHPDVVVRRIAVYAADAADALPGRAAAALDDGAVALIHSARAAGTFARLLAEAGRDPAGVRIACLSPAVAEAAGEGWATVAVADRLTDEALLAAAAGTCDQGGV